MEKKCPTDCREDLMGMMVTKSSLRWAVGIIITCVIAAWGAGNVVESRDVQRREAQIQSNTIAITQTREETGIKIAEMAANIQAIKENQELLLKTFGIKYK